MENITKWTDLIPDVGLKIAEVYDQGDEMYQPGIFSVLKQGSSTKHKKTLLVKLDSER